MTDQLPSEPEQIPPSKESEGEIKSSDALRSPAPPNPGKPRSRKRSPLLIAGVVILGLIIILAICLVLFFVVGKQFNIAGLFPSSLSQSFTSDQVGLTIRYPEGWVANEEFQGVTFATSNEIIQSSSSTFGEFASALDKTDAYFIMFRSPVALLGLPAEVDLTSPEQILDNFLSQQGLLKSIKSIKPGTINHTKFASYPAATSVSSFNEAGIPGKLYLALVLSEETITLVMGVSRDEGWRQNKSIFDSMLSSMELNPLTIGQ